MKYLNNLPALLIHALGTFIITYCVGAFTLETLLLFKYEKHLSLFISILLTALSYLYIKFNHRLISEEK